MLRKEQQSTVNKKYTNIQYKSKKLCALVKIEQLPIIQSLFYILKIKI